MTSTRRRPQLRIALNSRCGRACFYCRPSGEGVATAPGVEIDPSDLVFFTEIAAFVGLDEVKLTGGDPALYGHLVEAVQRIKHQTSVRSIELISRHPAIGVSAVALADAGVDLFNVSIDTIDPETHKTITGVDDLEPLLAALRTLVATGVPVKVNAVVMNGINDHQIHDLVRFCEDEGAHSLKLLDVIDDLDAGREFNQVRLRRNASATHLRDLYTPFTRITADLASRAADISTLRQGGLGHPMAAY
ncbi:MAG: radical SAM protein [bacterium]|nr:radical SAM protein [bacterium]